MEVNGRCATRIAHPTYRISSRNLLARLDRILPVHVGVDCPQPVPVVDRDRISQSLVVTCRIYASIRGRDYRRSLSTCDVDSFVERPLSGDWVCSIPEG